MQRILFILLIVLMPFEAAAGSLFLEPGIGICKSLGSAAVILSYRKETSPLFGFPSSYQTVALGWTGTERNYGIGIARGVHFRISGRRFLSFDFGVMAVERTTRNLGTTFEFFSRLAYNTMLAGRDTSIGLVHISNGKASLGWNGPNNGENFITFSTELF